MMNFRWSQLRYVGFGILLSAFGLNAGTIGPTCSSCMGGVYSLDAARTSAWGLQETWRVTYSLDLSGYTGPLTAYYVQNLSAHVVATPNYISSALVSGPTGGSGSWTQTTGNLNANGCTGNSNGWVCLAYTGDPAGRLMVGTDTIYSWVFDITVRAGSFLESPSIQANFDPARGVLMSETIRVPEGAAELPILLSGLLILFVFGRRSWFRAGI